MMGNWYILVAFVATLTILYVFFLLDSGTLLYTLGTFFSGNFA